MLGLNEVSIVGRLINGHSSLLGGDVSFIYCAIYMPFIWHIAPNGAIHGHMFHLTNKV